MKKKAVVFGAGGFIGTHLVQLLANEGYYVVGVDLKKPQFCESSAHVFNIADLRNESMVRAMMTGADEVYQLAADMGGAGYIFTGAHDFDVMMNSAQINLNVAKYAADCGKVFFSSSACIYPAENQTNNQCPVTAEATAYPANPDSEYGWEKLFAERLYGAAIRNKGAQVRIARFHNVYGPLGTYRGGREKAPAAICRKVAEAMKFGNDYIELWGDGLQTRSFMYIEDCLDGVRRLMESDHNGIPINLGSDFMISIRDLADMVICISGAPLTIRYTSGPTGVRGRTSDNTLCRQLLGWEPTVPLKNGMMSTYRWIKAQVENEK